MKTRDAVLNTLLMLEKLMATLQPQTDPTELAMSLPRLQQDARATIQAYRTGPEYIQSEAAYHEST